MKNTIFPQINMIISTIEMHIQRQQILNILQYQHVQLVMHNVEDCNQLNLKNQHKQFPF